MRAAANNGRRRVRDIDDERLLAAQAQDISIILPGRASQLARARQELLALSRHITLDSTEDELALTLNSLQELNACLVVLRSAR